MGNSRSEEEIQRDMVEQEINTLKEMVAKVRAQKDACNTELWRAQCRTERFRNRLNVAMAQKGSLSTLLTIKQDKMDAQATELSRQIDRANTCSSLLATIKDQRETLRSELFRATERLAAKQEKMDADQERYLTDMTREQAEVKALCRKVEKEQTEVQALRRHIAARRADIVREAERRENQPALRVSDEAKKRRELVEERDRLKEELTWAVTQKNTLRAELHRAMEERDGTESYRVQAVKARDQERAEKTAAETRNRGLTIEVDRVMVEKANLIKTNGRLKREWDQLTMQLNAAALAREGYGATNKKLERELLTTYRLNKGLVNSVNSTSAVLIKVRAERNEARMELVAMEKERDQGLDMLDKAGPIVDLANDACDQARAERNQAQGDAMALSEQVERLARRLATARTNFTRVKQQLEKSLERDETVEQEVVERMAGELATMRDCHRGLLNDYHRVKQQRDQLRRT